MRPPSHEGLQASSAALEAPVATAAGAGGWVTSAQLASAAGAARSLRLRRKDRSLPAPQRSLVRSVLSDAIHTMTIPEESPNDLNHSGFTLAPSALLPPYRGSGLRKQRTLPLQAPQTTACATPFECVAGPPDERLHHSVLVRGRRR